MPALLSVWLYLHDHSTRDKVSNGGVNDIYDGTAWLQALTFGYKVADVLDLRLEGSRCV